MDVQSKVYRTVATMAAGFAASQLVAIVWRLATKSKPPKDAEDLGVATTTAVVFAGLLGAATAVAQTLAGRHALKAVAKKERPTVAKVDAAS
jgi:F0F1-type ATP synthase membrane subunit c/vacuolar-type H+-ATPase subunit K